MSNRKLIPVNEEDKKALALAEQKGLVSNENEIWKIIFDGNVKYPYIVSNQGRVCRYQTGRVLSSGPDRYGYQRIRLSLDGKAKTFSVHRLVAFAFIENDDPETKVTVNHINHIRDDNHVENLEWMSIVDNVRDGSLKYDLSASAIERGDEGQIALFKERLDMFLDIRIFQFMYEDIAKNMNMKKNNGAFAKFKKIKQIAELLGYEINIHYPRLNGKQIRCWVISLPEELDTPTQDEDEEVDDD